MVTLSLGSRRFSGRGTEMGDSPRQRGGDVGWGAFWGMQKRTALVRCFVTPTKSPASLFGRLVGVKG